MCHLNTCDLDATTCVETSTLRMLCDDETPDDLREWREDGWREMCEEPWERIVADNLPARRTLAGKKGGKRDAIRFGINRPVLGA